MLDLSQTRPEYREAFRLVNGRPENGDVLEARRKGVELAQPLLTMLRTGATKPILYPPRSFEATMLAEDTMSSRNIGRLALASAYVQLASGASAEATTDLLMGLRYMDVQARNARTIGALTAGAIYSQAFSMLYTHVDAFSPAELARIEAYADEMVEHPVWRDIARNEAKLLLDLNAFTLAEMEKELAEVPQDDYFKAWVKLGPAGRKVIFDEASRRITNQWTQIETVSENPEKDWLAFLPQEGPQKEGSGREEESEILRDPTKAVDELVGLSYGMLGVATFATERTKWRILRVTARLRRIMAETDRIPTAYPPDMPARYTFDGLTGGQLILKPTSTGFTIESPGVPATGPVTLVSRLPRAKEPAAP